jgi:nucleoside-diphosphate-sugar epimerase
MAIMVTGGGGFIGARAVGKLLDQGHEVVCFEAGDLGRLGDAATDDRLHVVRGDVSQADDVTAAIRGHDVSRIIHLAAVMSPLVEDEPRLAMRVNVMGATNVFEAARQQGLERVVFASSIGVYGDQPEYGDVAVDEDAVLHPLTIYGHTKLINEAVACRYAELFGLDCRALRPCSVFGHGRLVGRSAEVSRVITRAAVDGAVEALQAPEQSAPLIYVDDVAELFVRLCVADELAHPVYLSGGIEATLGEVVDILRRLLPGVDIGFAAEPQTYPHVTRADGTRIAADLGYVLPPLEDRIREHIDEARRDSGLAEIG